MGLSAKKRAYYEEHLEAWRTSGLTQKNIMNRSIFVMALSKPGQEN